MNIIYCHLDSTIGNVRKDNYSFDYLPEYLFLTLKQNGFVCKKSKQVLICNTKTITNEDKAKLESLNVQIVSQDELTNTKINHVVELYKTLNYDIGLQNFNLVTLLRFFYVEEYMRKYNIEEILHLEYDNLLYVDVDDLKQTFTRNCMIPKVSSDSFCAGIVYINGLKTIESLNNDMIYVMENEKLRYLSEMMILGKIEEIKKGTISEFITLPTYDTKYLFDPCSYGQYMSGTNNGHKYGFINREHIVGRFIDDNKDKIRFYKTNVISMSFDGKKYDFVNLHIHNKNAIKNMMTI